MRWQPERPAHLLLLIIFLCLIAPGSTAEDQKVTAQLPPEVGALCLKVIEGKVWIGTSAGLYRETGGRLSRVGQFDQAIWRNSGMRRFG